MVENESTEDTHDSEATDFAVMVCALNKGRVVRELNEQIREITKAVVKVGKTGKLQLTLVFKHQKGTEQVFIQAETKTSKPKFDPPASIFFATKDGDLVREDPTANPLFEIHTSKEN